MFESSDTANCFSLEENMKPSAAGSAEALLRLPLSLLGEMRPKLGTGQSHKRLEKDRAAFEHRSVNA